MRIEKDLLGEMEIPEAALWGIHTARAVENFPVSGRPVASALIRSYALVKLACAQANCEIGKLSAVKFEAIEKACREMADGAFDGSIIVDALQGGAGTSTNMNVNEVLANRAIQILGGRPGDYSVVHPIEDVNMHQSTNDTYPTALKVAAIFAVRKLESRIVALMESFQRKEKEFSHVVKVGRTEMQDAVLTTMGRTMSAYAEALGRDRWRVYKCEERLRTVNLGGTAIGTGIAAPRKYIFKVVEKLGKLTGIGLARAENLVDATQNNDVFIETSGILKACAGNLMKICGDLRLMSSGPDAGLGELLLPARQSGSTIMPGKVNPVIPEAVTQASIAVISNDNAITIACASGNLELNAFLPLVADMLLANISLLENSCRILGEHCVDGLKVNEETCRRQVENSTAIVTALVSKTGYVKAQEIVLESKRTGRSVKEIVVSNGIASEEDYAKIIAPEAVACLGTRDE